MGLNIQIGIKKSQRQMEEPANQKPRWDVVAMTAITQGCRTISVLSITTGITISIVAIAWCLKSIYAQEQTILSIVSQIIGLFAASTGPFIVLRIVLKRVRTAISNQQNHTRETERIVDQHRRSSGMNEDGSHPDDV